MNNENKHKLLFADESEMTNEVMKFAFEMDQFKIHIANSKEQIIELCKTQKFDLIIININFDGIKTAKEIEKIPLNSNTKILIISKSSDLETKKEAHKNNVSGWIVKPFVPEKLVKSIRFYIKTST